MGAEITYKVTVIRTIEDIVEVQAVTSSEAIEEAANLPGVIYAKGIVLDFYED